MVIRISIEAQAVTGAPQAVDIAAITGSRAEFCSS
jgi:hypothetical protein